MEKRLTDEDLKEIEKEMHKIVKENLKLERKLVSRQEALDMFTKAVFRFDHAVASFQVGLGVKTEGSMTIAGTKGYVYVPAPWWKTDYFEVRYEDQNQNKKYFYPFVEEGLRYEIKDFVAAVLSDGYYHSKVSKNENLKMAEVQEAYIEGENLWKL